MSKYHDDSTAASDPGGLSLDKGKLSFFKKELSFIERFAARVGLPDARLNEHLYLGDSRAAVVVQVNPCLIVSAYTDELDCVVLLTFSCELISQYGLKVGSRLLTVNTYDTGTVPKADLYNGEQSYGRYSNFFPLIADFLSSETQLIEERKSEISFDEWEKRNQRGRGGCVQG